MSGRKKILIGLAVVALLGWMAYANLGMTRTSSVSVNTEKLQLRDLESIVTASGKVQPRRTVLVSNEAAGKVLRLTVREGDVVKRGQVLVEIDPTPLETIVRNRAASLASARSQLIQLAFQVDNASVGLSQAKENLKRAEAQMQSGLIAREQLERAQNDVKTQTASLRGAEQSIQTQQERIKQEETNLTSAQLDFMRARVFSPIDGIVTQRLIEEGETARYGALAGGVDLLAIADMSGITAEIEVDETDIPFIRIGQVTRVTIDALPGQDFPGRVTEVGNSPIVTGGAAAGRATNFKVKITIDGSVANVRPGFTCTAAITTATRTKALAVPIQAMTVREMIVDAAGSIVRNTPTPGGATPTAKPAPVEPKDGQTRKEVEGVFIVKDGHATFVAVKLGIAGEKYFETLSGLKDGDDVIMGPPTVARTLRDGDAVKATAGSGAMPGPSPAR